MYMRFMHVAIQGSLMKAVITFEKCLVMCTKIVYNHGQSYITRDIGSNNPLHMHSDVI